MYYLWCIVWTERSSVGGVTTRPVAIGAAAHRNKLGFLASLLPTLDVCQSMTSRVPRVAEVNFGDRHAAELNNSVVLHRALDVNGDLQRLLE